MEEHGTSLESLMIVVSIAFIVPILLHRFRLKMIPVVVAEIVAGLILGTSGFNLVSSDQWLELLSLFGFIYLMFLSGLEIDFSSFQSKQSNKPQKGPHPLWVSLFIFLGILTISFGLSNLFVLMGIVKDPYLMTIIIATISLGVVVPVLKEKRLTETPLGQTILMVTVVSDLITMILLAVYISISSGKVEQMLYLLLFFAVVIATYFFIRTFRGGKAFEVLKAGTVQLGTRAVFALIIMFVVLSETLEVEIILGAFLAGVIVSLLAPNKEFVHQLDSFGYGFLIPIFFVMIGVNLDIWELFKSPKILIFIPLLLIVLLISKLVPALILKKWFSWNEVIGSGILLSSTLSLVIAAATVAAEVGIITETMKGALILVAVLSCLLAPIGFNYFFPERKHEKKVIAIVGANHITLPVSQDLLKEGYEVELYTSQPPAKETKDEKYSRFPVIEVASLEVEELRKAGTFEADITVFATMDDEVNICLATYAVEEAGIEQVVVRVEDPEKHSHITQDARMTVMSTLYASRTLLKAVIEYPSAVKLITQHDDSIQEVKMNNGSLHNMLLKDLPFLGDTLILRIYRGDSFIIPHGTTEIKFGDRLLVSGEANYIHEMRRMLE
ncbi:monovalent cation:proton antiporter family protein [Marinicrinis sediminis]|uniref:Monovalent cation:proton antiporter family protein n=1 Tax=Marinicrinis sediminis TaxID=1652465 RepID=A0ABW5RAV5_9BACL